MANLTHAELVAIDTVRRITTSGWFDRFLSDIHASVERLRGLGWDDDAILEDMVGRYADERHRSGLFYLAARGCIRTVVEATSRDPIGVHEEC